MIPHNPKDLVPEFFNNTAKTYDKISVWLTFGKDRHWKKIIVEQVEHAETILDLACGTGILTRSLASKFPNASIIGVDITRNYLDIAVRNSTKFKNISYVCQDAEKLHLDQKFDCICSSYIPKYCNPEILIRNCVSHLNPNGIIVLHDFTYPKNIIVRWLWDTYFVVLHIIGITIPSWRRAFEDLPKLIKSSNWVERYQKELRKNKFNVKRYELTWNSSSILTATRVGFRLDYNI